MRALLFIYLTATLTSAFQVRETRPFTQLLYVISLLHNDLTHHLIIFMAYKWRWRCAYFCVCCLNCTEDYSLSSYDLVIERAKRVHSIVRFSILLC